MKTAKIRATLARNKKPLLALGAGVVVVLALWARKKSAGDTSADAGVSGDGVYAAGSTSTPSYYTAGSGSYDSSITDVYNAMQKQIDQFIGSIPVTDPYAPDTSATSTAIDKGRALSTGDRVVMKSTGDTYYRVEADGSTTPISSSTWSAFRNTAAGAKYAVETASTSAWSNILRAARNAVL